MASAFGASYTVVSADASNELFFATILTTFAGVGVPTGVLTAAVPFQFKPSDGPAIGQRAAGTAIQAFALMAGFPVPDADLVLVALGPL